MARYVSRQSDTCGIYLRDLCSFGIYTISRLDSKNRYAQIP